MASLRTIRRGQLLSQRDLARKSGVTASTIYLIENDHTIPRLSVMRRLCEALGVGADDVDEFVQALDSAEKADSVAAR